MHAADAPAKAPASLLTRILGLVLAAALGSGLTALGVWQVHRLAWKLDLIARVEQRRQAAPVAAPGPHDWPGLSRAADEYRRVQVRGRFDHARETLVTASTELGSGYWVLTPLCTDRGFWLLVNRGFVPSEWRSRASRAASEPQGEQQVAGLLRLSEPVGSLLRNNDAAAGRWYSRDVAAIAAARGLRSGPAGAACGPVAPYFIDTVAEPGQPRWPRAGLTVLRFSNNHAMYAFTWFSLAALVVVATWLWLRHESRLRRQVRAEPAAH